MPRIYQTCRSCRKPEPDAHWRTDAHTVLCAACHNDVVTAIRESLRALDTVREDADLFTLSPEAARYLEE